jgi:thiamine transport system ATP-binding protein
MIALQNGDYKFEDFRLSMDFELAAGSITAVLGPSGAGKSTLLNVIAGFEKLQSGRVILNDQDMTETLPARRPVSFVFQENNSFAHLSTRNNVGLGLSPALRLNAAQWLLVDDALAQVGIAHLSTRKPGAMSGGERQRIALARMLVRKAPILLLDEAFAALGPALRKEMLSLVLKLQRENNMTVLMVTHQPADAQHIADHVIFVNNGVVRAPVATTLFFKSTDSAIGDYLGDLDALPT